MFRVHIWLKKKAGMSDEEFRDYWLQKHAPIARDGYEHLGGYVVNVATVKLPCPAAESQCFSRQCPGHIELASARWGDQLLGQTLYHKRRPLFSSSRQFNRRELPRWRRGRRPGPRGRVLRRLAA